MKDTITEHWQNFDPNFSVNAGTATSSRYFATGTTQEPSQEATHEYMLEA